jgi:uncharacterized pyridoxamine 5'-phosphate oxidase family protein
MKRYLLLLSLLFASVLLSACSQTPSQHAQSDVQGTSYSITKALNIYFEKEGEYTTDKIALQAIDPELGKYFIDKRIDKIRIKLNQDDAIVTIAQGYQQEQSDDDDRSENKKKITTLSKTVTLLQQGETILLACSNMGRDCPTAENYLFQIAAKLAYSQAESYKRSDKYLTKDSSVNYLGETFNADYIFEVIGDLVIQENQKSKSLAIELSSKNIYSSSDKPMFIRIFIKQGEVVQVNCLNTDSCPGAESLLRDEQQQTRSIQP